MTVAYLSAQPKDCSKRSTFERFSFSKTPRLIAALKAGDEEAFRWLHGRWNVRIFRYSFALARGDDALAKEIAQSVYLRIFKHIRGLPDEAALWNWIAKSARSAAVDLRRTGGRYHGAVIRFSHWARLWERSKTTAHYPEDESLLLAALERALLLLDAEDRRLIESRYFERAPLKDAGNRLGLSIRAVEGRLARLRKKLKRLIEAELKNEGPRQ